MLTQQKAAPGWTPGSGVEIDCARDSIPVSAAPATSEEPPAFPWPRATQANILPAARKLAASWLAGIIARRAFTPDDLRQASAWAFGAHFLADRLDDPEAAAFLRDLDGALYSLSLRQGADVGAELGKLMMRINCQGKEARP